MANFIGRWTRFFGIILDPWNLTLILGVIGLFAFSIPQTNKTVSSLLFLLITLASGILGGRVFKQAEEDAKRRMAFYQKMGEIM